MSYSPPPQGHYKALTAPLYRSDIPDGAFRLWHVVLSYRWDGAGGLPIVPDLTAVDRHLAAKLALTERTVRKHRATLTKTGFFRIEVDASSGVSFLVATVPATPLDVDNSADNPPFFSTTAGRNLPEGPERQVRKLKTKASSLAVLPLRIGGSGGRWKESSSPEEIFQEEIFQQPVENPPAALLVERIAAQLESWGIWSGPAREIALRVIEAELSPAAMRQIFDHHWAATGGNIRMVVTRLKSQPLALPDGYSAATANARARFRAALDEAELPPEEEPAPDERIA